MAWHEEAPEQSSQGSRGFLRVAAPKATVPRRRKAKGKSRKKGSSKGAPPGKGPGLSFGPTFRKGKAPRGLLEKRFGESLLQETRSQLLSETYSKAIEEHKLRPVSEPTLAEGSKEPEIARGKAFTFTLEVEVAPDFKLPSTDGIEVQK